MKLVQEALAYGGCTHSVDDVLQMIEGGQAQFWPGKMSVVVTELIDYPRLRALRVWLVAGNADEIVSLEPEVTEFARKNGCVRLEMGGGRPGWERALKGWRKLCPCAVKEI